MFAGLIATLLVSSISASPQRAADRYQTGQVWAYQTRVGEEGSLVKIQAIEYDPAAIRGSPVYHISVIGLHFADPQIAPVLQHAPVSRATLDGSVTHLAAPDTHFPDATPGIEEWRRARGGVYTISIAQIVAAVDAQTAHEP